MKTLLLNAAMAFLLLFLPKIDYGQSVITANGPTTFCAGDSVILSGNVLGVWSNLSLASSIVVKNSGDYFVTNINILGGNLFSNHIIVNVIQPPTPSLILAVGLTTFCAGGSVLLTGNLGGTWNNGSTSASLLVTTSGDYFVTTTNACGTVVSNHIIVTVNPAPIVSSITANSTINLCPGATVTLSGNIGGVWSTGALTASIIVSTPGDYFVVNASLCGDAISNHIIVTGIPNIVAPVLNAVGSLALCAGATVTLQGNVAGGVWSTGSTAASIVVSAPGDYFVTNTNSCGSVTSNHLVVTSIPNLIAPVITASGSVSLCAGASVTLLGNVLGGVWSTGAVGASINVSLPGDYYVTSTNSCGSVTSNHIIVTAAVALVPPVITASGSVSLCAGASVTLLGNVLGGVWSTGAVGASINVSLPGDYYVTSTNSCGSVTSNHIIVTAAVALVPPVITASGSVSLCAGASVTLLGNVLGGVWSTGAVGASINVSLPGDYYVTSTNSCGSVTSNHIIVTAAVALVPPVITASGSVSLCAGASVTLLGNVLGGVWSTGAVGASINVSLPGDYYVTSTNSCGSVTSNHIIVTAAVALVPPVITASGSVSLCAGASVNLLGNVLGGVWSTGAVGASINVSLPGDYYVTSTNSCGSVTSNHIIVTAAVALVPPVITASGSVSLCAGASVTLLGNVLGGVWSTGAVGASINVSLPGDYYVTSTNSCGSVTSNHIIVTAAVALVPPVITASGSVSLCVGASVTLLGNVLGGVWSTGAVGASINVSIAGDYYVTTTNSCGTDTSNIIKVVIDPLSIPLAITAVGQINLCLGASVTLLGNIGGIWNTGATTASIIVSTAGDYYVTTTSACGTDTSNHIRVTANLLPIAPIITANASVSLCLGASVTLLGNILGGVWSTGAITPSITVSVAGDYFVTYTDACGSVISNHILVTVNAPTNTSNITANGPLTFCTGGSVTLSGNNGGTWSTGATTPSITVSSSGDYFVTNSNACGNTTSNHLIVSVNPLPSPSPIVANGAIAICAGASVVLSGNNGGVWSTGATTASITVNTAGDYFVTYLNACGNTNSNHIVVTVGALPSASVIAASGPINLCAGASVTLSGNIGGVWSTGATTASIIVNSAGDYFVTNTNSCGNTISNHILVTVGANQTAPTIVASGGTTFCEGGSVILTGNNGGTWSTGATTPSITVNEAGDYFVTSGCNNAESNHILVTVNETPEPSVINANNATALCAGQSVILSGNNNGGVWNVGGSNPTVTVSSAGEFWVINSNQCGTVNSNHIIVTLSDGTEIPPVITANGPTSICTGASVVLSGNNGGTWSNGATTTTITVTTSGNYYVLFGCNGDTSNQIEVTVSTSPTAPTISTNGSSTLCAGGGIILTGNVGGTWNNGSTNNSIFVTTAGDYFVNYTFACGNATSNHIQVNFHTPPAPPAITASGSLSLCAGASVTLSGNNGGIWNTGAITPTITVNTGGDYFVIYPDICTNVTSNHLIVTTTLPAAATITASGSINLCSGNSVTLSGNNGGAWNNGSTSSSLVVTTPGDYYVVYKNACDSVISNHIVVTITQSLNCNITSNGSLSPGNTVRICAASGFSKYVWSTGDSTSCITVTQAGTYSVTVTDAGGCTSTCSKIISNSDGPDCEISGNGSISFGQTTSLCAAASCNASYKWSTGATTRCITVSDSGTYSVTVTDASGHASTCSKLVTVSNTPYCHISGDEFLCEGSSTNLCAPSGPGYTYIWSSGETTSCITIECIGIYEVTITHNGITSTCSKTVQATHLPDFVIEGNSALCAGTTTTLCAPEDQGSTYLWSNGATTRCITVRNAGNFTVTMSKFDCSATSPVKSIVVNPLPICSITGNIHPNQGETTTLCAPEGMSSYKWSNGATTSCITINTSGTYSVKISNATGCASTCQAIVVFGSSLKVLTAEAKPVVNKGNLSVTAYPNPFNNQAIIEFESPESQANVRIELCTLTGSKVATLFEQDTKKGNLYQVEVNSDKLASGTYVYRIIYGGQVISKKLVLMK